MKTKSQSNKLKLYGKKNADLSIQDTVQSILEYQKAKNQNTKNDTTVSSLSQNDISTNFIITKKKSKPKDEDFICKYHQYRKKSPKKIKKKIILKQKNFHNKQTKNSYKPNLTDQKPLKHVKNAEKGKKNIKDLKCQKKKQNVQLQKIGSFQKQTKPMKVLNKESNKTMVNLCDQAQIKMIGFQRKLLLKKRQDLVRRIVDDWNLVDRGRSQKRELRNLNV